MCASSLRETITRRTASTKTEKGMSDMTAALFRLGRLVITPQANAVLNKTDVRMALGRHVHGDYGEVSDLDKEANAEALKTGDRILSAYYSNGIRYWIITEADRTSTTVLLPDDY